MLYLFGDCELEPHRFELRRQGQVRPIEPQVFDVLVLLIREATSGGQQARAPRHGVGSPLRRRIGLDQPDQIGAPGRRRRRHNTRHRAHRTEPRLPVRRPRHRARRPIHRATPTAGALPETESRLWAAFGRIRLVTASVGSECAPVKAQHCRVPPRRTTAHRWDRPASVQRLAAGAQCQHPLGEVVSLGPLGTSVPQDRDQEEVQDWNGEEQEPARRS